MCHIDENLKFSIDQTNAYLRSPKSPIFRSVIKDLIVRFRILIVFRKLDNLAAALVNLGIERRNECTEEEEFSDRGV